MLRVRALTPLLVITLAAGCGGKVVVDVGSGAGGTAGAGGTTGTGTTACLPVPQTGNAVVEVCVGEAPGGGCAEGSIADVLAQMGGNTCPDDPFCACSFVLVSAPCPPDPECCYQVEAKSTPIVCE
ncbi:MAG: hypothetical protein QM820_30535 [Minicystis sp.]